jgi:hypothetical protein
MTCRLSEIPHLCLYACGIIRLYFYALRKGNTLSYKRVMEEFKADTFNVCISYQEE